MNSVVLVGRLARDPEVRVNPQTQNSVARFTIAVDRGGKDRNGEDRGADFISCVAFGKTGEFIERYFTKGKLIAIQGRIQTGKYEKDGRTVYTTDVVAERAEFVGSKSESGDNSGFNQGSQFSGGNGEAPAGFSTLDDDIPF